METLIVAVASFFGFIIAYHTYGRFLARKLFRLSADADVPSHALRDGVDYVPTRREVVFGHHFTSIAGTGPIVGPAIAVFWGWLPALLWVVFGSIFIGGVHDLGALVVSLRHRGQTIGEVAGDVINKRVRLLFLFVLFVLLLVVIAVFALVIATIFDLYPGSVFAVWCEIPLAVAIGFFVYRTKRGLLLPSLIALAIMYFTIYIGTYFLPLQMPSLLGVSPVVIWALVLMAYCFVASVLPVWTLLQPRDFINSHELLLALVLLMGGLFIAHPKFIAPAINHNVPADAPPILPFLFITVACGAISGFHSLVSSGTSSKQLMREPDAQLVGYGSMLLEATLAVLVIIACAAGIGMGLFKISGTTVELVTDSHGSQVVGKAAFERFYGGGWAEMGLSKKLAAFVDGGANMLSTIGIPLKMAVGVMAVLVSSFAATTMDTATRLQRYVITELGNAVKIKPLTNRYVATLAAVVTAAVLAMIPAHGKGPGTGGLILWPLFGCTNQILAGLVFMVLLFYLLLKRGRIAVYVLLPMIVMLILPAWAMVKQIIKWSAQPVGHWHLIVFGVVTLALMVWFVVEGVLMWRQHRGGRLPYQPA